MKTHFVDKFNNAFIKSGEWMSLIFVFVVAIGFLEVVLRYVFNSPTSWVHETTEFLISISLIYGGVCCYAERKHICMDFIRLSFSKNVQWWLILLVEVLTLIFMLMLTYGSYLTTKDAFFSPFGSFKMQTSGSALDSPFPALNKGFFFISCIIMLLICLSHVYRHISNKNKGS